MTDVVVLVPGCQNDIMLQRRVRKLVEFTSDLHRANIRFSVVLSGRCPTGATARIPNEATRMNNLFRLQLAEERPDLLSILPIFPLYGEDESNDTKKNVENFFSHLNFTHSKNPVYIVAISSTFHLIRLWNALNFYIGDHLKHRKLAKGADKPGREIRQVSLIGAEDALFAKKPLLVGHFEYVKLMTYDLYEHYLNEQPHSAVGSFGFE
jgi:hypothetical protein